MCTHNQCFRGKKKNIIIFHLKINIFPAVKYCCILHGRVCVMAVENVILMLQIFLICYRSQQRQNGPTFSSTSCFLQFLYKVELRIQMLQKCS